MQKTTTFVQFEIGSQRHFCQQWKRLRHLYIVLRVLLPNVCNCYTILKNKTFQWIYFTKYLVGKVQYLQKKIRRSRPNGSDTLFFLIIDTRQLLLKLIINTVRSLVLGCGSNLVRIKCHQFLWPCKLEASFHGVYKFYGWCFFFYTTWNINYLWNTFSLCFFFTVLLSLSRILFFGFTLLTTPAMHAIQFINERDFSFFLFHALLMHAFYLFINENVILFASLC